MNNDRIKKEYDVFRDSLFRYLGYTNEVGEAFRPLVPKTLVNSSYGVAVAYVLGDVFHKSQKDYKRTESIKRAALTAGDVLIWQMCASVIIPGLTINRVTWLTGRMIKQTNLRKIFRKILPTAVGLLSIPVIIHPIDSFVDYLMDNSYRYYAKQGDN